MTSKAGSPASSPLSSKAQLPDWGLDAGTRFVDYDPGPGYRPFFAYSEYPAG